MREVNSSISYLGVFTFFICCIPICLVCIVASFKLSCVWLSLVSHVYCCSCLVCIVVILCVLLYYVLLFLL